MAIKYLSGNRIWGTNAERLAMTGGTLDVPQTTWKELGQDIAGVGGATELEVTFTAKDYLTFLIHSTTTTTGNVILSFGGSDYTSTDYFTRRVQNGSTATTDSDGVTTSWRVVTGNDTQVGTQFGVYDVWNDANDGNKIGIGHSVHTEGTGTTNVCQTYETTNAWIPDTSSTRITRVKIQAENPTYYFADGTELIVLGMDREEADGGGTTNFWQEIASVTGNGSSTTMTTGTKTFPKYLMMEIYGESMVSCKMKFNGETSADFQRTYTSNGGDWTQNNATVDLAFLYDLAPAAIQLYMVNVAGKEKLIIGHTSEANNSSTALFNMEIFAKNTDTAIITEISVSKPSGNFTANDNFRIWGHD